MPSTTLADLARHLGTQGIDGRVVGDERVELRGVNTLEDAALGDLSFLTNPKYRHRAVDSKASAIIVSADESTEFAIPLLRCTDPYAALTVATIHLHGYRRHPQWGVSPRATVSAQATIGVGASIAGGATIEEGVAIGARAVIYPGVYVARNVTIGDDVLLYPNVTIYEDCKLGARVTIHAGSVIGEDGLGYAPVGGKWLKIPQVGCVIVDDDVEIGANCTIDRATVGATRIGSGTKFSDLVAIGHGAKVGRDCMLVAQVGIAGSAVIGNHVTIAGQAGVVGHIEIGDNAQVGAKAGVVDTVEPGVKVLGAPAVPIAEARRQMLLIQRLPELNKRMKAMEHEMERLHKLLQGNGQIPH